ncbi:methylated-DNA--[protein]-cysteine S-methyltransferase [Nocardia sp. CDC159]|uniref:Methylated-DNA--protein-cysteine methyltransferase n=1 Tax=Nocardia pulmonis TaxID=2951408 RepID=A0A9X2J0S2_9NOCA|nr:MULTISPECIES: methylated-DNA--[protein]-cysteine S-methyltransferase [Nocardia]MCM6778119.1 methylated-DNA--[protein]-cysteine S-methyltransferase [Nocardia pulmonis]MCM6791008.1 methylated-DNA--[protein]-cysteine S-methyltransferase [Nocardia sp. CDC159]
MSVYTTIDSPLGELLLVGEQAGDAVVLTALSMAGGKGRAVRAEWVERPEAFTGIVEQLRAYFAGERTRFDIEYDGVGSDFQRQVWQALDEIPYGSTVTYGQIAARIGAPRAAVRAVGAAIGANPLLIVRPCHRVIGANGSLTGYAGGVERKRQLLELEHVA